MLVEITPNLIEEHRLYSVDLARQADLDQWARDPQHRLQIIRSQLGEEQMLRALIKDTYQPDYARTTNHRDFELEFGSDIQSLEFPE